MREPALKVGGAQERVMQSLEALTTLGGSGGPGKAVVISHDIAQHHQCTFHYIALPFRQDLIIRIM